MKTPISAVILARNEEGQIAECLKHLQFCDEIVVIDGFSTDKTALIAKKIGAKVYKRHLNGDYSKQRNHGAKKAKHDWVLMIDADERVGQGLAREIKASDKKSLSAYKVKRQDVFMNKKLKGGENGSIYIVRLYNKKRGKYVRKVHEYWQGEPKVSKLSNSLVHYSHKSIFDYVESMSTHSRLHAKENRDEGKSASLSKIFFYPIFKFVNNFIVRRGYRDGVHGFVNAMMMSFHSFLAWTDMYLTKNA